MIHSSEGNQRNPSESFPQRQSRQSISVAVSKNRGFLHNLIDLAMKARNCRLNVHDCLAMFKPRDGENFRHVNRVILFESEVGEPPCPRSMKECTCKTERSIIRYLVRSYQHRGEVEIDSASAEIYTALGTNSYSKHMQE